MRKFLRVSFQSSSFVASDKDNTAKVSKKNNDGKSKKNKTNKKKKVSFAGYRKIKTVHKISPICSSAEHANELWYSSADKQTFQQEGTETFQIMVDSGKSFDEIEEMGYCTRGLENFVQEYHDRVQTCRKEAMLAVFLEQRTQFLASTQDIEKLANDYAKQAKWNKKLASVNAKYDRRDCTQIYAEPDEELEQLLDQTRHYVYNNKNCSRRTKKSSSGCMTTMMDDAATATTRSSISSMSTLGLPEDFPDCAE